MIDKLPQHWIIKENTLFREYEFSSFEEAMRFMQLCSVKISELNHHPNWSNVYNKVRVSLSTHDAGDVVTDKDYMLAEAFENIYRGV